MKKIFVLAIAAMSVFACKKEAKKETVEDTKPTVEAKKDNFPEALNQVFQKHGGIDAWRKAKTLSYKINDEEHTVDLHSRRTVVNAEKYALGFDGKEVWLHQQDSTAFKGNKDFYYNLYFYFYAMPFVLADDGIVYSETKPLEFEGKSYPGIKISYKADVGLSPDDNYYIYYDADTKQMAWLGYTVTYFSKKPSEKFNIIRYHDWEKINGFLLPKAITWYKKDEQGNVLEPARDPIVFSEAQVTQATLADSFFEKPKE